MLSCNLQSTRTIGACRGTSGYAHLKCLAQAAESAHNWVQCQTCKAFYTGAALVGLARAGVKARAGAAEDDLERLHAARRPAPFLFF